MQHGNFRSLCMPPKLSCTWHVSSCLSAKCSLIPRYTHRHSRFAVKRNFRFTMPSSSLPQSQVIAEFCGPRTYSTADAFETSKSAIHSQINSSSLHSRSQGRQAEGPPFFLDSLDFVNSSYSGPTHISAPPSDSTAPLDWPAAFRTPRPPPPIHRTPPQSTRVKSEHGSGP